MRTLLRVVRARRWRELSDTLVAQIALLRAQFVVYARPQGRLIDAAASEPATPSYSQVVEADGLSRAIVRASRYGVFRPQCLVRALALQQLLERRRIAGSVVRIGVRRSGDALLAHAWVELAGLVLGDTDENTDAFSTLAKFRMAAPSGRDA